MKREGRGVGGARALIGRIRSLNNGGVREEYAKFCKHKEMRTLLCRLRESCTSLDKSLTLLLAELVKGQEGCRAPEVGGGEDDGGGDGEEGEENKDEEKKVEVEKVANAESSPSKSQ